MKKESHSKPPITIKGSTIGGLLGYFVLHPFVMVTAYFMVESGSAVADTNYTAIAFEVMKSFSSRMLPWSLAFTIISAILGALYERNRQVAAALRESEKKFRELSITDDLTGLYNSRHFFSRLKDEIERSNRYGHPLSLLILDFDNFKHYNDTCGHLAGDKVLQKGGAILKKSLRKTDSAYRYGGEEFTVILPESSGSESLYFAERIRKAFEKEVFLSLRDENLSVTVSIGVAQYTAGEEITTLVKRADKNLYAAKNRGKNRIYSSTWY